jgi:hypothetical protein
MDNGTNALLGNVDHKVGVGGGLVGVIDTGEALDFTAAGLCIDTALVSGLTVLEGSVDVDQEERATGALDSLTGRLAGVLVGSNGGSDDSGTGAGEFTGDEGDTLDVGVAVLTAEAQLRGELVADSVTKEKCDGASTLLVESDLESTSDGVLAGVHVTGKEDGETLKGARRARLAQDLDNFGVREPLRDVGTGTKTVTEFSSGDVEGLGTCRNLVLGHVLIGVGEIGDLLELNDLDTELRAILLDRMLSIVGAVELLTLGVLTGTGVVTANNEVGGTVVFTDDSVPDSLTGTAHAHSKGQESKSRHSVGVAGKKGLVGADTGEVVNVTGLGETDHRVDKNISLAGASGTDGQFTVSSVHRVSGVC